MTKNDDEDFDSYEIASTVKLGISTLNFSVKKMRKYTSPYRCYHGWVNTLSTPNSALFPRFHFRGINEMKAKLDFVRGLQTVRRRIPFCDCSMPRKLSRVGRDIKCSLGTIEPIFKAWLRYWRSNKRDTHWRWFQIDYTIDLLSW